MPRGVEPALLHVRVRKFDVSKAITPHYALNALLALDEVRTAMKELKLDFGTEFFSILGTPDAFSINIQCRNMTVRQILNAIARAFGRGVWDYAEKQCDGKKEVLIRF